MKQLSVLFSVMTLSSSSFSALLSADMEKVGLSDLYSDMVSEASTEEVRPTQFRSAEEWVSPLNVSNSSTEETDTLGSEDSEEREGEALLREQGNLFSFIMNRRRISGIDPLLKSETAWLGRSHRDPYQLLEGEAMEVSESLSAMGLSKKFSFRVGRSLTVTIPDEDDIFTKSETDSIETPKAPINSRVASFPVISAEDTEEDVRYPFLRGSELKITIPDDDEESVCSGSACSPVSRHENFTLSSKAVAKKGEFEPSTSPLIPLSATVEFVLEQDVPFTTSGSFREN